VTTRIARRGGWTLADQIVSSGTNFTLVVLLARAMPAASFGAFVLLYGYYVVCIQLAQTAFAEPLLVRFPRDSDEARRALRDTSGAAVVFGLAGGVALLPLSVPLLGGITAPVLVLAAVLPALLVQDTLRMGFIAAGQPRKAMVTDVAWGVSQCLATLGVLTVTTKLAWVLLAWAFGGLVATGLAMAQARVVPRVRSAPGWLREYGDLARPYIVEGVALTVSEYGTLLVVGRVAGLAAVGSLRIANALFGPAGVLIGAGRVIAIAELSRVAAYRPHRVGRGAILIALGLGTVGAVSGLVAMVLPGRIGASVFGSAWSTMVPLLPALTIYRIAQGAVMGPTSALRAVQAIRALFWLRLAAAAGLIAASALGARLAGAGGAATGLATAMTLACLGAFLLNARHRRIGAHPAGAHAAHANGQGNRISDDGVDDQNAQEDFSKDHQPFSEAVRKDAHSRGAAN
jgi:O-antigen/teichoic acid export membrane protein